MTAKAVKKEHISRCYLADLVLDNPMTNGHTTTCDLLWSGTPIITFPISDNMPSRVAMSILAALGVKDQTTCYTYTEYANAAKKYALGNLSDLSPVDQAKYH
jgi:protein O-GlcNAc transferase